MVDNKRLTTVDCLRGVAALAVCCAHTLVLGAWKGTAEYGWLGVYIFFVLSGFIVPYSLALADYRLTAFPRFLVKRIVRLDPPYFASIAAAIVLHYISYQFPQFRGPEPNYSLQQILLHLAYLNSFFSGSWIIIVYWTLGIEFQYYVIVGLLHPLLVSTRSLVQIGLVAICALGIDRFDFPMHVKADQGPLLPHYAFVFLLGVQACRFKLGLISKRTYLVITFLLAVVVAGTCGPLIGITVLCTSLVIVFVRLRSRILIWLGSISYSLYLFHYLVGGRVLGVGLRLFHGDYAQYALQIFAVLVSLLVAFIMCRLVEVPAMRLASRIRLKSIGVTDSFSETAPILLSPSSENVTPQ